MKMLPTLLWSTLLIIGLSMMILEQQQWAEGAQQVPCYFIFGDSLVDCGNNNNLPTLAKTNYPPYGVDFPEGPTGRFCNGRTAADIVGQLLGFEEFIPPFASASGPEILKGVNYGSGTAGILNITGYNSGARISLDMQLRNHEITILEIEGMIGKEETQNLLNKCIYTVGMGSNDYFNNYFMPQAFPKSSQYTPQQFASILIDAYSQQLETLYNQGARKVAVYGLGLLGCVPNETLNIPPTNGTTPTCVEKITNAAIIFNNKLKPLLNQLNSKLHGANFTYLGVYMSALSPMNREYVVGDPVDAVGTCCEIEESTGLCRPFGVTSAAVRKSKVFWDGFHPTEAANERIAGLAYKAQTPDDASPCDISQLAAMS